MSVTNEWWVCEDGIQGWLPSRFLGRGLSHKHGPEWWLCESPDVLPQLWWPRGHPGCPLARKPLLGAAHTSDPASSASVTSPASLWPALAAPGVGTSAELFGSAARFLVLFF